MVFFSHFISKDRREENKSQEAKPSQNDLEVYPLGVAIIMAAPDWRVEGDAGAPAKIIVCLVKTDWTKKRRVKG